MLNTTPSIRTALHCTFYLFELQSQSCVGFFVIIQSVCVRARVRNLPSLPDEVMMAEKNNIQRSIRSLFIAAAAAQFNWKWNQKKN